MSRVPSKLKQRDVTRALKAIAAARVVARVEIDKTTGNIIIIPDASAAHDGKEILTPLDEWIASHGSNQT
jgi:hypothetical protein